MFLLVYLFDCIVLYRLLLKCYYTATTSNTANTTANSTITRTNTRTTTNNNHDHPIHNISSKKHKQTNSSVILSKFLYVIVHNNFISRMQYKMEK